MSKENFVDINSINVQLKRNEGRRELDRIDFSNPGHLKLALLSQGITVNSARVFETTTFAENQFPYGYNSDLVKGFQVSPSEMVLPGDVTTGLHFRKNSPWELTMSTDEQNILLSFEGKTITEVGFNPKPHFFGQKLSNGQDAENVAVMYGTKALSFFTRGWCFYFTKDDAACGFCSLNPTRDELGKDNMNNVTPALAKEAAKLAFSVDGDRILYVNHCAGSLKNNDLGVKMQIDVLKAVKEVTPKGVKHHMLTMPPDDFSLIQELKASGVGTLNFALEVFNPDLFRQICKGKEAYYGYDKFLEAYKEGVKAMGDGNMYANFVGGLEGLDTMATGFEHFAKQGVVPSINVFHPDPESQFALRQTPSIPYLLDMVEMQTQIYKDYQFSPIYPIGGTRNSLDIEVSKGYFK